MLTRRTADNGVVFYASPLLEAIGVPHAFTTRLGGVSDPGDPFGTLNLGNPSGHAVQDDAPNIRENYRLVIDGACLSAPSFPRELCRVHQVHGADTVIRRPGDSHDPHARADALVTDDPARILSVRVADCVPVIVATGDGSAVAAIHAGWRGVASGIVRTAAEALRAILPGLADRRLFGAIGPCIGVDAFEVGPEVVVAIEQAGVEGLFGGASLGPVIRLDGAPPRPHVDLREALRLQLLAQGLAPERIDSTDRCTFRHADEFFSHRRERGLTGRMAAFVSPRPSD